MRRFVAILLAVAVICSCLYFIPSQVEAKSKTVNITLKYKNKKVILAKYSQNKGGYNSLTYHMHFNTVKKRLGIGKTDTEYYISDPHDTDYAYYVYNTRKDRIIIDGYSAYHGEGPWVQKYPHSTEHSVLNKKFNPTKGTALHIVITSKNFSLNGIKVGMSKKAAEKQLRKYFKILKVGKDSVHEEKLVEYTSSYIQTPCYSCERGQFSVYIKNGKVCEIRYQDNNDGQDGVEP